MTQKELRNAMIKALHVFIGRPVVLSDQTVPEAEYPYVYYQPVQPYMSGGGTNITREVVPGEEFEHDIITRREEEPEGTFSFTACSRNRKAPDGSVILGDDEALDLAECAQGFFLHAGALELYDLGIVVVEVYGVFPRSALEVDEVDRRYGFDVRVRYARVDERRDGVIENGTIKYLKE